MPRAVPEGEALRRAALRGMTPLEPYPGKGSAPWLVQHSCGRPTTTTAANLLHQGGCTPCGAAVGGRKKARRGEEKAWRHARAACLTPLTDYPGSQKRWPVMCDFCGDIGYPFPSYLVQGHRIRCKCHSAAIAARNTIPLDEWEREFRQDFRVRLTKPPTRDGDGKPLPAEGVCMDCGDRIEFLVDTLRKGYPKGCSCQPRRHIPRESACSVAGCARPVHARRLCTLHYGRQRRARLRQERCVVEGCGNPQHTVGTGLCASHYTKGADHLIGGQHGWNPGKPAVLYLIRDDTVWKYGKAMLTRYRGRLAQHDWHIDVVDSILGAGSDITRLEDVIRQNVAHLRRLDGNRDGYQETHYRADLDPASLSDLIGLNPRIELGGRLNDLAAQPRRVDWERVLAVYSKADSLGVSHRRHLMEVLGLTQSNANNYVRALRAQGLIGERERRDRDEIDHLIADAVSEADTAGLDRVPHLVERYGWPRRLAQYWYDQARTAGVVPRRRTSHAELDTALVARLYVEAVNSGSGSIMGNPTAAAYIADRLGVSVGMGDHFIQKAREAGDLFTLNQVADWYSEAVRTGVDYEQLLHARTGIKPGRGLRVVGQAVRRGLIGDPSAHAERKRQYNLARDWAVRRQGRRFADPWATLEAWRRRNPPEGRHD